MAGGHWWNIPIDPRDVEQERQLALLERRCPIEAAKEWRKKELLWYRYHLSFPDPPSGNDASDYVDSWVLAFHAALPQEPFREHRSLEGVIKRREYVREWWRKNGSAYRARRRKDSGSPRRTVHPRSRKNAGTD